MVPTVLSDADAAHLVGMCAACKRAEGDPLRVLQLGVSEHLRRKIVGFLSGRFESHANASGVAGSYSALVAVETLTFRVLFLPVI